MDPNEKTITDIEATIAAEDKAAIDVALNMADFHTKFHTFEYDGATLKATRRSTSTVDLNEACDPDRVADRIAVFVAANR